MLRIEPPSPEPGMYLTGAYYPYGHYFGSISEPGFGVTSTEDSDGAITIEA